MAPKAYGELEKVYHSDPIKLLTNLAVGLFLLGVGILSVIAANDRGSESMILFGLLATLGGLIIFVRTLLYNFGQEVRLYQHGVEFRRFWQSRRWFYDQITGIQITAVAATARGNQLNLVRDYTFYDDQAELFRITPVYFNWAGLGQELVQRVTDLHIKRDRQRIQDGFELVYDELLQIKHLERKIALKVNLFGVIEEGKPLLPWARVDTCRLDHGEVLIEDVDGQVYSSFPYFNTINSFHAMTFIQALVEVDHPNQSHSIGQRIS